MPGNRPTLAPRQWGWWVAVLVLAYVGHPSVLAERELERPSTAEALRLGPSAATAAGGWSSDLDRDGLPDEVEYLVGSHPLLADSDGDGAWDLAEWVFRSSPVDALDVPLEAPSIRMRAYQKGKFVRVFTAIYPGNLRLVDTYQVYLASPAIPPDQHGDDQLGILAITPLLSSLAPSFTSAQHRGLSLIGFTIDLDLNMYEKLAPLSVGVAARVAGTPVVARQLIVPGIDRHLVMTESPAQGYAGGAGPGFIVEPLDPAGDGRQEDPEYCETKLGNERPTGGGAVMFEVTSADCVPNGVLYCVGVDCEELEGQTLLMIDYGFLQSQAGP